MHMMVSSRMKGRAKIPEKGHPTIAPMPNHMMPTAVLGPLRQSMKAANPRLEVNMAKVEGRKATDA
jgi:hypothetical protein